VIGIHIGRTYSRVGIYKNNALDMVTDGNGRSVIPSYVAFTDDSPPLVGFTAANQAASNPKNTIYDAR
jgi:heat shock protein 1/8